MKTIYLALLFLSNSVVTSDLTSRYLNEKEYLPLQEDLKKLYGNNKIFDEDLELASLVALRHFPELENTRIKFKRSNTKTTMATRPAMKSIFTKREKRTYVIYVDKKVKDNNGILTDDIPFNALVGLIGHEFVHIMEYEKMSMWQIAKLGCQYSKIDFKTEFEQETDRKTIQRGLGWQLMDWANYSMKACTASCAYKDYKKLVYLNKDQIVNHMSEQNTYAQYFKTEDDIMVLK